MKQRIKPAHARSLVDVTAFRDVPYITFTLGAMLGFIGLYVGFFYVSFFGQSTGITDESLSFYLIPILNAASVFGRTLPNIIADKIGPLNVIIPGSSSPFPFLSSPRHLTCGVYRRRHRRHRPPLQHRCAQRRGHRRQHDFLRLLLGHLHCPATRVFCALDGG